MSKMATKIWDLVPIEIKKRIQGQNQNLEVKKCACRTCKTYLPQIGFIT